MGVLYTRVCSGQILSIEYKSLQKNQNKLLTRNYETKKIVNFVINEQVDLKKNKKFPISEI